MTTPTNVNLDPPRSPFAVDLRVPVIDPVSPPLPDVVDLAMVLGVRATEPYAEFSIQAWRLRSAGDRYRLYGNDQFWVEDGVSDSAALDSQYFLRVPGTLLAEGLIDVYLEVDRTSRQVSRSPTEKYLVKKTHPAGIDHRPDILGHDGLRVVAEGLSEFSPITRLIASTGMWAVMGKYLNARLNDRLQVWLDGNVIERRLSAEEAAGPGPYRVFIPPAVFQRISQSGTVTLLCTVIDVAGNRPFGSDFFLRPLCCPAS